MPERLLTRLLVLNWSLKVQRFISKIGMSEQLVRMSLTTLFLRREIFTLLRTTDLILVED
jgi:hypothetical protein